MSFHYRYRKQIRIGIIILLLIGSIISFSVYKFQTSKKERPKTIDSIKVKKENEKEIKLEKPEQYMVDIKGEVTTPGIYQLEKDARVVDVIEKAGGLTENADTTVINLSKKITDEMVIIIYSKKEVGNWITTKEQEKYLQEKCISPEEGQVENDACIESDSPTTSQSPSTININTATKEELMTLSGIGEAKAEAIITYREQTPFETIEDLKNVSGIGDTIYEEIKDHITV